MSRLDISPPALIDASGKVPRRRSSCRLLRVTVSARGAFLVSPEKLPTAGCGEMSLAVSPRRPWTTSPTTEVVRPSGLTEQHPAPPPLRSTHRAPATRGNGPRQGTTAPQHRSPRVPLSRPLAGRAPTSRAVGAAHRLWRPRTPLSRPGGGRSPRLCERTPTPLPGKLLLAPGTGRAAFVVMNRVRCGDPRGGRRLRS